jgi:integrase
VQVLAKDTRVVTFLNCIGRNSKNSRKSYQTGLIHFAEFLKAKKQTPDTIVPFLQNQRLNSYEILDNFVSYLTLKEIATVSLRIYVGAVRSYLEFHDIDIVPSKFRRRVKLPKFYFDSQEPLSLTDIRDLLEFCSNTRLRTFILLLTSTGLRATEAAALRIMDIDFTTNPTKINVRKEYTKTKRGRTIYCSDEATKHIHKLIEIHKTKAQEDLIFAIRNKTNKPGSVYNRLLEHFERLQHTADKDARKENSKRRKITLHSFRRTAFSIINEQTNSEYANWFLGHNHSVYWTHKEQVKRDIYRTKCMPFLTVYQETRDNTIEDALREKDLTIKLLTNRIADIEHDQKIIMDLLQDGGEQLKRKLDS